MAITKAWDYIQGMKKIQIFWSQFGKKKKKKSYSISRKVCMPYSSCVLCRSASTPWESTYHNLVRNHICNERVFKCNFPWSMILAKQLRLKFKDLLTTIQCMYSFSIYSLKLLHERMHIKDITNAGEHKLNKKHL